jgi:phosphomannomutase
MNLAVVRAATLGLAPSSSTTGGPIVSVVVGYDHRHGSERFARRGCCCRPASRYGSQIAWPTP